MVPGRRDRTLSRRALAITRRLATVPHGRVTFAHAEGPRADVPWLERRGWDWGRRGRMSQSEDKSVRLKSGGSGPVLGGEVLVLHLPRMVECVVGRVSDEEW